MILNLCGAEKIHFHHIDEAVVVFNNASQLFLFGYG